MPGLLRAIGRTAVVAGTATAVSNRVSRRQAERWQGQDSPYVPSRVMPDAPPPPAPAAAPAMDPITQLKELAELRQQGILTDQEFAEQKARILAAT
jgi:putative oligomerization/nucleic acid binding protein